MGTLRRLQRKLGLLSLALIVELPAAEEAAASLDVRRLADWQCTLENTNPLCTSLNISFQGQAAWSNEMCQSRCDCGLQKPPPGRKTLGHLQGECAVFCRYACSAACSCNDKTVAAGPAVAAQVTSNNTLTAAAAVENNTVVNTSNTSSAGDIPAVAVPVEEVVTVEANPAEATAQVATPVEAAPVATSPAEQAHPVSVEALKGGDSAQALQAMEAKLFAAEAKAEVMNQSYATLRETYQRLKANFAAMSEARESLNQENERLQGEKSSAKEQEGKILAEKDKQFLEMSAEKEKKFEEMAAEKDQRIADKEQKIQEIKQEMETKLKERQEAEAERLKNTEETWQSKLESLRNEKDTEIHKIQGDADVQLIKLQAEEQRLKVELDHYSDPDLRQFLEKRTRKVSFQNNSFRYELPSLKEGAQQWLEAYEAMFRNSLDGKIQDEGVRNYLPIISGVLAYGLLAFPLVGACCLTGVICAKEAWLRFFHLYFGLTTLAGAGFAVCAQEDPLLGLASVDGSAYLLVQGVLAMVLGTYGGFLLLAFIASALLCRGRAIVCMRFMQTLFAGAIGFAYYLVFWAPLVADEMGMAEAAERTAQTRVSPPWAEYALTSVGFFILWRLERSIWATRRAMRDSAVRGNKQELANLMGASADDEDHDD